MDSNLRDAPMKLMARAHMFQPPAAPVRRTGFPVPGPQDPTGSEVMEDTFFLTPAQWQAAADKQYEYVVIGSGFCALAFAHQVLQMKPNTRILLLERGPFFLPAHFQTLPQPMVETLGGLSETFPWTVDLRTATGQDGDVRACHGSVPFFGGRSTLWSTWCPKPTPQEMEGWPAEVIKAAQRNFDFADKLLRVQATDQIDKDIAESGTKRAAGMAASYAKMKRPVYGSLQATILGMLRKEETLAELQKVAGIDRVEPARLASADENVSGIDFLKYSVPGDLLALKQAHATLDIKLGCTVRKIFNQQTSPGKDFVATALDTSCGVLPLGADTKLVLAMGALPPATLVQNSFNHVYGEDGARFSAHFISSITARVPRGDILPSDLDSHQVGALYISGTANGSYKQQFHIQLSIIADPQPQQHAALLQRYMPDVVATATKQQLDSSKEYVILVCAVLGELNTDNDANRFKPNPQDPNPTTNSLLRVVSSDPTDLQTWEAMEKATYAVLNKIAGEHGRLEYWNAGDVQTGAQPGQQRQGQQLGHWQSAPWALRVPDLVHESSTLAIGEGEDALVSTDYKLRRTNNVFVTGAGLWPRGGSWNPTHTMVALAADLATKLVEGKPGGKREEA